MSVQAHYVSGTNVEPPREVHVSLPLPQAWTRERGLAYLDDKYTYPTWVRVAPRVKRREAQGPSPSVPEGSAGDA